MSNHRALSYALATNLACYVLLLRRLGVKAPNVYPTKLTDL